MQHAKDSLKKYFGFNEFRPGQEQVIRSVLNGNSALAIFPTGQGKSLCYQLPALHFSGLTLVVSPLMALMKDQVDYLISKNIAAAKLDSSLNQEDVRDIYQRLHQNQIKLLYVAPERFANERFVNLIGQLRVSMMVIDEAHCISEWGHNFRPDYLKLTNIVKKLKIPQVLALTATATPEVRDDIKRKFSISEEGCVQTGFYRPNLTLNFSPSDYPDAKLLDLLEQKELGATIVYVTTQKQSERLAEILQERGYLAKCYHAGLKDELRQEVQEWFMNSDHAIVVATIAFGMGIDKNNIRYVYHYSLPKSLENYSQEVGRAGRDGNSSTCTVIGSGVEINTLENFIYGDTPEEQQVIDFVEEIAKQDEIFSCSEYELSQKFDLRPLVVKTLLTYLELEGLITSTGPFYTTYKVKFHIKIDEIINQFDPQRQEFLRALFACGVFRKVWTSIDLEQAVEKTKSPRSRVIAALDFLAEKGFLTIEVSGLKQGFRKLANSSEQIEEIKGVLIKRFVEREQSDLQRIGRVLDFVNISQCKVQYLLKYFGEEKTQACGHCSFCQSGTNEPVVMKRIVFNEEHYHEVSDQLDELKKKYPQVFRNARQVAKFLCGIGSPSFTRNKLSKHALFGKFELFSFEQIMEWFGKR